jgi:guanylate kinase
MVAPVRLKHLVEFQDAIAEMRPSEHARHVLGRANLVAMSGLAGGGRNTVINYLVEHHKYYFIVSDTTRPPKLRNGVMERDGINYYFRTEEGMLEDIRGGEFIEAEIIHKQQVSGTSIREIERANEAGRIAVHDFEYKGAQAVAAVKPNAHIVGLLPSSYDVWLKRLFGREELHPEEFANRLQTAEKVLEAMIELTYFKFVINDTIEQAADDLRKIVEQGIVGKEKQRQGRDLAEELLLRVRRELTEGNHIHRGHS